MSPARQRGTLLVVPARNEEATVAAVLAAAREALPHAAILVVDDASTDRTAPLARAAGAHVVSHPFRLGYGAALQTGFKYAIARGFDVVGQLDADGQHDPAALVPLLEAVWGGHADVAVGSRFLGGDPAARAGLGPLRLVGARALAAAASLILGQHLTDTTSGLRVMSGRAARLCATDAYPVDYPDADTLIMLQRSGMTLVELPVHMRASTRPSNIHSGLRPLYYGYKMSLSIFVTLLRGRAARR